MKLDGSVRARLLRDSLTFPLHLLNNYLQQAAFLNLSRILTFLMTNSMQLLTSIEGSVFTSRDAVEPWCRVR